MSLGSRLREARRAKKLTQADVADQLHVSVQAVSQWETNKTTPSAINLIDLSKYLGMDLQGNIRLSDLLETSPPGRTKMSVAAPLVEWDEPTWQEGHRSTPVEQEVESWLVGLDEPDPRTLLDVHWEPIGEVYALSVGNQYMNPVFRRGDMIIVDTGRAPERGDYVVASVETRKGLLLATYVPKGLDKNRAPLFDLTFADRKSISIDEANPGRVIATVREHRRYYRTEPLTGGDR